MAVALLADAKKSMSALQLQRHLGVNYRTAWYLAHRIREAMVDTDGPKLTYSKLLEQNAFTPFVRPYQRLLKGKRWRDGLN
jgi:hypothetical protein